MTDPRVDELKNLLPQCLTWDWVRLGSRLVRLLRDRHHPQSHEAILRRLHQQALESVALREERGQAVPAVSYPPGLPITSRKDEILEAIRRHQVVVISGETGSGKTTQIPKICLEAGLGIEAKIGCTQPRRVAALSISRRIAEELNVSWGREVGCKIRFDDRTSPHTYIKMMTDGILLAETQGDPLLSEYNAIIIDEAHERSLNIDFLLGHLKGLLQKREDLKLIITSATIDTEAFSKAFDDAPVLEVSGRMYPVEVVYAPFDEASQESGDMTYIDAAVTAVEDVLSRPGDGDVLIFMPGERDIRETRDQLQGRFGRRAEIIPLFGRLSSGEQQRVFEPCPRRKIVVATNIAETSLTIPGIRFVIDAGLARLSRYNPRTRTRRLPVEPVSQSSARQRQGRCGRVRQGICIRLYGEEDFLERPAFTQPEIQRANLAEVILRMKAFRLGDIETFPFINPPLPPAIAGGYKLLQELGALDEERNLTTLGRDLARLPIDPTLGRMLLQSQQEHATRELLIIAAGLSIQDPRERPLDKQQAADDAHKKYLHPQSDFLTLLNLWDSFHDQWEQLRTQNHRRKFCRKHFLSYTRMREWQDLHAQLQAALKEQGSLRLNESNAHPDAVHRSVLTGLLGHVSKRKERNLYLGQGNRQLMLFPGSVLFERTERRSKKQKDDEEEDEDRPKKRVSQPEWVMAGEIVETSQVFARTVAGIDPAWIPRLAPHLCRTVHERPRWEAGLGKVVVQEKTLFQGREVRDRTVSYGPVEPRKATRIFIRSALVEGSLTDDGIEEPEIQARPRRGPARNKKGRMRGREPTRQDQRAGHQSLRLLSGSGRASAGAARFPFYEHNLRVMQQIENWRTRMRQHDIPDLDGLVVKFYEERIHNVSSLEELARFVEDHPRPEELKFQAQDLLEGRSLEYDENAFPSRIMLGGQPVELSYAYAPGEEWDGVTLRVPLPVARMISPAAVEWAVPGLREKQAAEWLRALPKSARKQLMPFPPRVKELAREFVPHSDSLFRDLAGFIGRRYGVDVSSSAWDWAQLPAHLRPRLEIVGSEDRVLAVGRDLPEMRRRLEKADEVAEDSPVWTRAAARWERFDLETWNFGDLPEKVTVVESPDLPVFGWPGLEMENERVNVRLFHSRDEARISTLPAVQRLVELALRKDLAWMEKDLRVLSQWADLYEGLGDPCELPAQALEHLKRHLLPGELFMPLSEAGFSSAVLEAREAIKGLAMEFMDRLKEVLQGRKKILQYLETRPAEKKARAKPSLNTISLKDFSQLSLAAAPSDAAPASSGETSSWRRELDRLLPKEFLRTFPFERLGHLPRHLKALQTRMDRARLNPRKDRERAGMVIPFEEAAGELAAQSPPSPQARRELETFLWMIEEFKVSLFAQELGTAFPVSGKRMDEALRELRRLFA